MHVSILPLFSEQRWIQREPGPVSHHIYEAVGSVKQHFNKKTKSLLVGHEEYIKKILILNRA